MVENWFELWGSCVFCLYLTPAAALTTMQRTQKAALRRSTDFICKHSTQDKGQQRDLWGGSVPQSQQFLSQGQMDASSPSCCFPTSFQQHPRNQGKQSNRKLCPVSWAKAVTNQSKLFGHPGKHQEDELQCFLILLQEKTIIQTSSSNTRPVSASWKLSCKALGNRFAPVLTLDH